MKTFFKNHVKFHAISSNILRRAFSIIFNGQPQTLSTIIGLTCRVNEHPWAYIFTLAMYGLLPPRFLLRGGREYLREAP